MKGRPKDPTRARRRTGHRRKPDEAPALKIVPVPGDAPYLSPPRCEVCGGEGALTKGKARDECPGCAGTGTSLPAEMVSTWTAVVAALGPTSTLRDGDAFALELLVRQYHRVKQAGELVDKYGIVSRSESGAVTVSPFVKAERDATAAFLRLAEHYGLTVASRMRLGLLQLVGKTLSQQLLDDLRDG
jgi:P27 family predicted phage terminase small subunit